MNSEEARQALADEVTARLTKAIAATVRKRLARADRRKQLAEARQAGITMRNHQKDKRANPSPGCGGCYAPVPGATVEAQGWRIWVLQAAITQKPSGRDDIDPMTEPAGTIFVLCEQCTALLNDSQYHALAEQIASIKQCTCDCPAHGQVVAEMVTWLMQLRSWALPMTEQEWLATR